MSTVAASHCHDCGVELSSNPRQLEGRLLCEAHYHTAKLGAPGRANAATPISAREAALRDANMGITSILRLFAWLMLIAGVVGGLWLWSTIAYVPRVSPFGNVQLGSDFNPAGAAIAFTVIAQGVLWCVLLLAVSIAVNDARTAKDGVRALLQRQ
jgi:hypothetical protein